LMLEAHKVGDVNFVYSHLEDVLSVSFHCKSRHYFPYHAELRYIFYGKHLKRHFLLVLRQDISNDFLPF
jgi:hypothetical protein